MILNCLRCNKEIRIKPSRKDTFKYCSRNCKHEASLGKPTWNKGTTGLQIAWNKGQKLPYEIWNKGLKGIHLSPRTEFKKGDHSGEASPNWKGENVGYAALHKWVVLHKGKPDHCEYCIKPKGRFEWANKSHEYKRVLDDWIQLCTRCHRKYDGFTLANRKRDSKGRLII